jgi:hypothetical protein
MIFGLPGDLGQPCRLPASTPSDPKRRRIHDFDTRHSRKLIHIERRDTVAVMQRHRRNLQIVQSNEASLPRSSKPIFWSK